MHALSIRTVAAGLLLCAFVAGCGGSNSKSMSKTTDSKLAPADERAYLAIARASGSLRAGIAAVAVGKADRLSGRSSIENASHVLAPLRPRDPELSRAKRQIDDAMRSALTARPDPQSQHTAAKAALAATDAVNRELRRYADRRPGLAQLIPD